MSARKVAIAGGAVTTYALAVYFSYHYIQFQKKPCNHCSSSSSDVIIHKHLNNPKRNERFQEIAKSYDDKISMDECVMGMNLLRRALLHLNAKGIVLEVASGTCRNLSYYPDHVKKVVLTDTSDQMLLQAMQKIKDLPDKEKYAVIQLDASYLKRFDDDSFDTVVDTFGLCSFSDPVSALKEMQRVCKKKDGKILLLEHGTTHKFDFVREYLNRYADDHARKWGCIWNRDIEDIVRSSGLKIDYIDTWHFGTTYYIVCSPQ